MKSRRSEEPRLPRAWVDAWRADQPRAGDMQRAYQTFLRSRWRPPKAFHAARWGVAGLMLGLGAAYAASGAGVAWFAPAAPPSTPSAAPASSPGQSAPATKRGKLEPTASAATAPLHAASSATPPASSASVKRLPSLNAPAGARLSPAASSVAPSLSNTAWQRAARYLREGDFRGAEAALLEIEAQPSAAERDAARLARAELLLHRGRTSESHTLLRELAHEPRAKVIQARAKSLLARSSERSDADRSNLQPPETK